MRSYGGAIVILALASACAACKAEPGPAGVSAAPMDCLRPPHPAFPLFWLEEREAAPGETVALTPGWYQPPGGVEPIDPQCVGAISIDDNAPAVLSPDARALTIDQDAAHGTRIQVRADVPGGPMTDILWVASRETHPIIGAWRQSALDCDVASGAPASPASAPDPDLVSELTLRASGAFTVTWGRPFETYVDYYGRYTYDPDTGAITFLINGGNAWPRDFDGNGRAVPLPQGFELHGVSFGRSGAAPGAPTETESGCVLRFGGAAER